MGDCCDSSQNFLPPRSTMRVWAENPHVRQSSSCSFVRQSKSNPVSLLPQTGHFSSPSVYTLLIFLPFLNLNSCQIYLCEFRWRCCSSSVMFTRGRSQSTHHCSSSLR